jgi:hypothetical protein
MKNGEIIESKKFVHTPNWVLLVVPATVMYELEEAANIRFENGNLKYEGRMAFRALQEIIELTNNIDIPGVSLLIIGEADLNLEVKTTSRRINENLFNLGVTVDNFRENFSQNNGHQDHHCFKGIPSQKASKR